jgi:hypothetical protein
MVSGALLVLWLIARELSNDVPQENGTLSEPSR